MRKLVIWCAALAGTVLLAAPAAAQFPQKTPITIVVPYPPGGLADVLARLAMPKLSESLGTPVVVDNKPGANGSIGTAVVARAKPDGHTLAVVPASVMVSNSWLYKDMPFDPIKDLTPITLAMIVANVLVVNPNVPAKNVSELLQLAKEKPDSLNYASMGMGSSGHLNGELFKQMGKVNITHVPYRGSGPALQDLLSGSVQIMFDNLPNAMPMIQDKRLRPLGVTSPTPSPFAPDVPAIGQFLPGFEAIPWFGVVGPAGLAPQTVETLNQHWIRAIRSPEVGKVLEDRGAEMVASSAEAFRRRIVDDHKKWGEVIKTANIKIE